MKGIAICILALISSGPLAASNVADARGGGASSAVGVGRSLPAGVELRPIFRIYRDKTATHNTNYYWPSNWEDIGWKLEGSLGSVSSTQFENSIHIRSCVGLTLGTTLPPPIRIVRQVMVGSSSPATGISDMSRPWNCLGLLRSTDARSGGARRCVTSILSKLIARAGEEPSLMEF